jgi:hypothetical protein
LTPLLGDGLGIVACSGASKSVGFFAEHTIAEGGQ